MTQPIAKFHEEVSAKIPALTLLTNLGYEFIPPAEMAAMRDSQSSVVLVNVLRQVLKTKVFYFKKKQIQLLETALNSIIEALHEKPYKAALFFLKGIGVKKSILIKKFGCYNKYNITATPIEEAQPWRFFIAPNKWGNS